MNAENWEKVIEIVSEVLEVSDSKRNDYLENLQLDAETRREIESLLTFEDESVDFMSLSAGEISSDILPQSTDNPKKTLIGSRIGIYEVEAELGLGGMGAVYLATRADGKFSQRVAVKMLKREFNVEKIRRRFLLETKIQSRLEHPNVVRLLDAGTTDDGVPFLVMEYVEGIPVDRFCRENSLDLNERLKLFQKICEAVSFAHQNLTIHRDLKPTNILVNEKGEPKLLDFGISKLLDGANTKKQNTVTMLGAMTPEYASPEQIRGEIVTTATDIYSLGVILYKMLTGQLPYDFDGKTNEEVLKVITETEPTKPSAVTNYELRITNKKRNPKSEIPNPKSLKGDLDNIILKALSKEPTRRYQTVREFSADIWRFVDGLPVTARPATFSYRADKFLRRNKIAAIAGVLIFLSLVTGIFAAVREKRNADEQARIAVESRNVAESETAKAKAEQERAEKISRFMFKVISYANPQWYAEGAKYGGNARVIDAMNDLSGKIDTEFAGQPDVQSEIHHKFTEVYNQVEESDNDPKMREYFIEKRKFHARRALELRKQFYGERHELVAKDLFYSYGIIGEDVFAQAQILMHAIDMMRETNPNNLNLPYMFEAYAARLTFPQSDAASHEIYRQAALPETGENKYEIAEKMLLKALPLFRLHYKDDNVAIAANECRLAYVLAMQEKWTDFKPQYEVCKKGVRTFENDYVKESIKLIEEALAAKGKK